MLRCWGCRSGSARHRRSRARRHGSRRRGRYCWRTQRCWSRRRCCGCTRLNGRACWRWSCSWSGTCERRRGTGGRRRRPRSRGSYGRARSSGRSAWRNLRRASCGSRRRGRRHRAGGKGRDWRRRAGRNGRFLVGLARQLPANLFGHVHGNGTRVGLLFRNAVARKQVDDRFGFDFQLASQFIDAYLICVVHLILMTAWRSGSCLRETRSLFRDSVAASPLLPTLAYRSQPCVSLAASCASS